MAIVPFPKDGLGPEGNGIVSRVTAQTKDFVVGDRVIFLQHGSFSTHVVAPESLCVKVPDNLTLEQAAAIVSNICLISALLIYRSMSFPISEYVLITWIWTDASYLHDCNVRYVQCWKSAERAGG